MSLLTGLASYYGARGQARQRQSAQDSQNAYQQSDLALRKSEDAQRADYDAQQLELQRRQAAEAHQAERARLTAQGINPDTGERITLKIPAGLTQVVPHNKGQTLGPVASWLAIVKHNQALAAAAQQQGAVGDATFYANAARDAALNANSLANAGYTSGAKTDLTGAQTDLAQHRVSLIDAQAAAARDLPERAREIARNHDTTALQKAAAEIANRTELARFNGNLRVGIAQLAAQYRANGLSVEDALRLAINDNDQRVKLYLGQTDPRRTILGGGDPGLAAPTGGIEPGAIQRIIDSIRPNVAAPGVTINIGPDGRIRQTPGARAPAPRPTNSAPTLSLNAQQQLAGAEIALQNNVPLETVLSTLTAGAAAHGLTPQDVQAIRVALSKHLKPLPVQTGGWGNLQPMPLPGAQLKPLPVPGASLQPLPIPGARGGSHAAAPFPGN